MCKSCIYGSAAQLAAAGTAQLVRVEGHAPASWALDLESSGPATFAVVAGSGQASRTFNIEVSGGRTTVQVVAQALTVKATAGASGTLAQAFASPGTAPERAADIVAAALVIGPTILAASGRLYALVYNSNAVPVDVALGGVLVQQVAPNATARFDWAGPIELLSASTYNVVQVWR